MEFETLPFTVVVDTREQHPWAFRGFRHDADRNNVPMIVPIENRALDTGDYSISGLEQRIAIERKSLDDLYNTVIHGRTDSSVSLIECVAVIARRLSLRAGYWPR